MKKPFILTAIILTILALAIVFFISDKEDSKKENNEEKKIKVVTTLFPLYDITKNIGGESVDVSLLLDPGIEAHSFEPAPSDMVKISQADIFIYTGNFMEIWAEDILKSVNNPELLVIDASKSIDLIENTDEHGEEDGHEEELGHEHEGVDPHIWLDFDNLKIMVNNINDGLKNKALEGQEDFELRAASYIDRISLFDKKYREELDGCQQKSIIYSGHYAFAYLAQRYGLSYSSAYGLSPNSEPSAEALISLTKQLKETGAKYIFQEELLSPRVAEVLERETGAKILNLSAAHNLSRQDLDAGKTLFSVFEDNLNNLKLGLNCR